MRFILSLITILFLFTETVEANSIPEFIRDNNVKIVTHWNNLQCIVRRLEDSYEVNLYKIENEKIYKIYSGKFDGVYKIDSTTSDYFLIIFGSSAVSTQISLLKWNKEKQIVSDFDDKRFDGDSRLRPGILLKPNGFQLITFGNIHDTGWEKDKSKWFANVHTFKKDSLINVKKVPFSEKFTFDLE